MTPFRGKNIAQIFILKKKSPKKFLGHNFWLKTQAWVRVKIQKYLPTHARTHTCKYTRRYAWTREREMVGEAEG